MPRRLKLSLLALLVACCAAGALAQEPSSAYRLGQTNAVSRPRGATRVSLDEPAQPAVRSGSTGSNTTPAAEIRRALPLSPPSTASGRQMSRPATSGAAGAVGSVVGSLAVVLGLFLAVVWLSRRFAPAGAAQLPKEAVELLGRTTVSGQHTLQLLRVGGRLLLVALSPHGATTLTQISDPAEVERLTALCQRQRPQSVSASFRDTIRQLDRDPAGRSLADQRRPASAVANSRTKASSRA
ncbi:MAG TPA: flagellar biosynthetic protein FliO [Pirellulaceae bacterium]|nr:flagellar biosynthetic protein FliO [Pirellulaceae bacterium]